MNVYFLSDFHLKFQENEEDRARRERVLSFLRSLIGKADILILNGDIFDLWFDWNSVIIKGYFPLLKVLADLDEKGCRLILVAGNHDFWFNNFLPDYLNMEIYSDYFEEIIDNVKVHVTHGDRHTSNDLRYKLFRAIIRNRVVKFLFQIIHPDLALKLGRLLSRSSRERKIPPTLKKKKEQGLIRSADKILKHCDLVVMGHSHSPLLEKRRKGTYVNLGDWITSNSYLEMTDGKFQLKINN
jgi:UDP-2,3-diacylglucosamine hydrolase